MKTASFADVVLVPVMKICLCPYSASESTLCGFLCRSVVCYGSWEFQLAVICCTCAVEDEDLQEDDANDQGENIALGQDEPWELPKKDDTYSAFMN